MEFLKVIVTNKSLGPREFLIDKDDLPIFEKFKWTYNLHMTSKKPYMRLAAFKKGQKCEYFHRMILNVTDSNVQVDHANMNPSDNRKINLRICPSGKYNAINRTKQKNNTSGYKGVFKRRDGCYAKKSIDTFRAAIRYNQKLIHLGNYKNIEIAAEVYNYSAKYLFGEFAFFNDVNVTLSLKIINKLNNILNRYKLI